MIYMRKKFIAIAMLGVFLFSGAANAQINGLPLAGTTPGSPLFFLDRFFEDVSIFFTFGEANKARRYLAFAEERLAETQALAERQDDKNTAKAADIYEEQFAKAKERAERAGEIDLEAEVTSATTRHLSVFDQVLERAPEQAREHIRAAKERTMTGQIEALRGIAERNPKRAAGIFATAAEGRLRAAQFKAERGGDDEEEAEEVEEALGEYEKYAQFGEEISQIAEGLGAGETEARTLVERATEQHLQVLEDVKTKAPSQAQDSINRAMQNAERVKQFLPADIPGRVGPGAAGQNGGAPEQGGQIPQDAREQIPGQQERGGKGETNGGAPAETPGARTRPEGVGENDEDETEIEEDEDEIENGGAGQQGEPPVDVPGGRP